MILLATFSSYSCFGKINIAQINGGGETTLCMIRRIWALIMSCEWVKQINALFTTPFWERVYNKPISLNSYKMFLHWIWMNMAMHDNPIFDILTGKWENIFCKKHTFCIILILIYNRYFHFVVWRNTFNNKIFHFYIATLLSFVRWHLIW